MITISAPSMPDRNLKPSTSLYSESGLRTISLSPLVMAKFLSVAQPNTAKNIETCAILAGKLEQDQFHITHILVPKQNGKGNLNFIKY